MRRILSALFPSLLLLSAFFLSACDLPIQQMEPTERGVVFRKLPPALGGGVSSRVVRGGELVYLFPWDSLIRINTGSQDVLLGEGSGGDSFEPFVFTRALDGNEVAVKMTIRYQVSDDPEKLEKVVQHIADNDLGIRNLVIATSRAMIRKHMNSIRTSDFLQDKSRYAAVERVREGVREMLEPYGISILGVMLDRFEFARLQPDGTVDRQYQEKLNEIQRFREETERERLRIDTVRADGQQRYNTTQAQVNRMIEEAKGAKIQATLRGKGYLDSKSNEAKGILAKGKAEVDGIIEKINALSGPGGEAILKLDVARHLQESDPRFVLMGDGGSQSEVSVNKLDTNELLSQLGLLEGMKDKPQTKIVPEGVKDPVVKAR